MRPVNQVNGIWRKHYKEEHVQRLVARMDLLWSKKRRKLAEPLETGGRGEQRAMRLRWGQGQSNRGLRQPQEGCPLHPKRNRESEEGAE